MTTADVTTETEALTERLTSLARLAAKAYNSHGLPPSLTLDDLQQQAVLTMLRKHRQAEAKGRETNMWILVSEAKREIYRMVKKTAQAHASEQETTQKPSDISTLGSVEQKEEESLLSQMLRILPEDQREAVKLHYGLGDGIPRSKAEVGRQLNLGYDRVRALLDEALDRMAKAPIKELKPEEAEEAEA